MQYLAKRISSVAIAIKTKSSLFPIGKSITLEYTSKQGRRYKLVPITTSSLGPSNSNQFRGRTVAMTCFRY